MSEAKKPVVEFLTIAWIHAGGDPHSWGEFNSRINQVTHIVAAGFPWNVGDIDELMKLGSWRGRITTCLGECGFEGIYSTAVRNHNVSAYKEIERYIGRNPIIADGANGRKRDRLCVGAEFEWKGEQVRVTSFNKDGKAICCSYSHIKAEYGYTEKLKKRYTIGSDDIKADRKARKEFSKKQKATS